MIRVSAVGAEDPGDRLPASKASRISRLSVGVAGAAKQRGIGTARFAGRVGGMESTAPA